MACCKCCCGGEDCTEGQEGKCCCGGVTGACCQPGEYCCSGVCQADPCDECAACSDCEWPADIDEYGTGGCSIRYTGLASRNATVSGIITSRFNSAELAWKSGYPAALANCKYAWWFLETQTPATSACPSPDTDTYCYRYVFRLFLLLCNSDGSTTDITNEAVTATSPEYLLGDYCLDSDNQSECPCASANCSGCVTEPAEVLMDCAP